MYAAEHILFSHKKNVKQVEQENETVQSGRGKHTVVADKGGDVGMTLGMMNGPEKTERKIVTMWSSCTNQFSLMFLVDTLSRKNLKQTNYNLSTLALYNKPFFLLW